MPTLPPNAVARACLDALEFYGYARQPQPLRIVELSFEFDAVLAGPAKHHDLVLLVDQETLDVEAVRRRLTSLALALSRTGSRRPIAVVLIAPPSRKADLEPLRPLARLVTVRREAQTSAEVADALREFRPLSIDELEARPVHASRELAAALGKRADVPAVQRLIAAATDGEAAVKEAFHDLFVEALADPASQ